MTNKHLYLSGAKPRRLAKLSPKRIIYLCKSTSNMVSEYEKQRLENIKRNQALLASLGFDKPTLEPKEKRIIKRPAQEKKRKIVEEPSEDNEETPRETKASRVDSADSAPASSLRRSSRNTGKVIDYNKEIVRTRSIPVAYSSGVKEVENDGPLGREDGMRVHNPKTYGPIPGVEVGTWWAQRKGCSVDAIHAPWVAGIAPGPQGAYSVALSGGYDDDVDEGYAFTYTGSGGRDLKGTKDAPKNLRTAPQSSDQSFDNNFNKSLQRSCDTKKPVRVIRGYKLQSRYAPSEGFRYDGLYTVEKAWVEKGRNRHGYLVCKFVFKRLPGQPALPVRSLSEDAPRKRKQDEESDTEGKDEDMDTEEAKDAQKDDKDEDRESAAEEDSTAAEDNLDTKAPEMQTEDVNSEDPRITDASMEDPQAETTQSEDVVNEDK